MLMQRSCFCTVTAPPGVGIRSTGINLWNNLKKEVVPLTPRLPGLFTWYACGPTVYDSAHIGHASSYIRQDVIRRILEGMNGPSSSVLQVMGVTNIDDKIIHKANKLNVPWESVGRKYELEFFQDLQSLNVKLPHATTRVTDFIPQILDFVSSLVASGIAYPTADGSVYFDVTKYDGYGKLRPLASSDGLEVVEQGVGKRNQQDFALWKGWKEGEPFWKAPWGKGRPGWHIECSVMASYYFGSFLDIHSGGTDLIFPHHENEEAQCCARFGIKDWVSHWIHTGHLHIKGDVKMSKSLGNTITIQDFLKDNSAEELRMFCMMKPYRHGLEFTPEAFHVSKSMLHKFESFSATISSILQGSVGVSQNGRSEELNFWDSIISSQQKVFSDLSNDFDTPSAIHTISEFIDSFNHNFKLQTPSGAGGSGGSSIEYGCILASGSLLDNFLSLVGISNRQDVNQTVDSAQLENLLDVFTKFRSTTRNFALATEEDNKSLRKQKIQERMALLSECDRVRHDLSDLGLQLTEQVNILLDELWSFGNKAEIKMDHNQQMDVDDDEQVVIKPSYPALPPIDSEDWQYVMRRTMQEVIPGLFLGPYAVATKSRLADLQVAGITHIVCVREYRERNLIRPNHPDNFIYMIAEVEDSIMANIIPLFKTVNPFIRNAIDSGGKVLVHGSAGISRSVALVIAFVMEKFGVTVLEAHKYVQSIRFCSNPNEGFMAQLREYEPIYRAMHVTPKPLPQGPNGSHRISKRSIDDEEEEYPTPNPKRGGRNQH